MKGFTLIELLVVVLIIGILSAVALPQYTKAVAKSRIAGAIVQLKAVENAEKIYWMANNYYTLDLDELDISLPCIKSRTQCFFSNGSVLDLDTPGGVLHSEDDLVLFYSFKNLAALELIVTISGIYGSTGQISKTCRVNRGIDEDRNDTDTAIAESICRSMKAEGWSLQNF